MGSDSSSARCAREGGLKDESSTAMSICELAQEEGEEQGDEKGQVGVVE